MPVVTSPLTADQIDAVMRARRSMSGAAFDIETLWKHSAKDALIAIGTVTIESGADPLFADLHAEYRDGLYCSTPMICDALNLIVAQEASRRMAAVRDEATRKQAAKRQRDEDRLRREHRCLHCHRLLSDPESIARGYGPECATKVA